MASSALVSSVSKPAACSLHQGVNAGKGLPEFSGLRSTNACLPFSTKTNDDFFSLISFQTSGVGGKGYKGGVTEAKLKVAINGFGRIGRNFLRCWHGREGSPLEVIAINDSGGVKPASHLLKYDSTLGIFDADVKPVRDNAISVDGKIIEVVSSRNPLDLPWKDLEVGLVIEGTGVFVDREGAEKHIHAGAKKVLITAPGKGDIPTYVVGVNADAYTHEGNIISNASCITNCLAPFVKVLDQKFVLLPSGRDASKRREVLFSTFGYLAGVLWHDRLADVAVSSEFADMPALRGKDYGKSKMRYPDYTETKSGLQYKDLRLGDGPIPKMGEIVVVDWDGYTIGYYGRIFEARNKTKGGSFEGGEKEFFKFKLGSQEVIPAFEEAVAGMAPGGIRRIIVPPELGYPENDYNKKGPQPTTFSGQRALDFVLKNQGLIDKTLLFDIELLKVVTNG